MLGALCPNQFRKARWTGCLNVFAPAVPSILKSSLKSFSPFKTQFCCHYAFGLSNLMSEKNCLIVWMSIAYLYIYLACISFSFHAILKGNVRDFKRQHAHNIRKTRVIMVALHLSSCVTLGCILSLNCLTSFHYLKNVGNNSYST